MWLGGARQARGADRAAGRLAWLGRAQLAEPPGPGAAAGGGAAVRAPGNGRGELWPGGAASRAWLAVRGTVPSRASQAASQAGLASALRKALALVAELDKVVLPVGEVEEIAGTSPAAHRVCRRRASPTSCSATTAPFREQGDRLLICATENSVTQPWTAAFLRHGQVRLRRSRWGRPTRPAPAREAVSDRCPGRDPAWRAGHGRRSLEESRLSHPGRHRVRRAQDSWQLAFERVLFERGEQQVTTGDVLHAVGSDPPHPDPELVAGFSRTVSRTTPQGLSSAKGTARHPGPNQEQARPISSDPDGFLSGAVAGQARRAERRAAASREGRKTAQGQACGSRDL